MKKCPILNCGQSMMDRMFVCTRHWQRMPVEMKQRVSETFRQYLAEEISMEDMRRANLEVLSDFQCVPAATLADGPKLITSCCRRCGCQTLLVPKAGQQDRTQLEQTDSGGLVVFAFTAMSGAGFGPQYTRYKVHDCAAAAARMKVPA